MNSSSAIDCRLPGSLLEVTASHLMSQISGLKEHFRPRATAYGNEIAAPRIEKSKPVQSKSANLTSGSSGVRARRPIAGANDLHVRFQNDIVPHLDAAYNFARFLSRNADTAQDIVQEAFLRAYRGFEGYQGGDSRAWVFTIVRNCYYNWLVNQRRTAGVEIDVHRHDDSDMLPIADVPSEDDDPEVALLRKGESSTVRLVLNKLPRALREMLVLRELEGLSYRQIAEATKLPIGTVMSRLARARTHFESAWHNETTAQENKT